VYVTSNYTWKANSNDSWISLNTDSGYPGTTSLVFNVAYNSSESERLGSITVYTEDYNLSTSITICQYGNSGNGGHEFAITVSEITATSAHIKVEAKEATRTFYSNMMSKAAFAEYESPAALMNDYYAQLGEVVAAGQYTWETLLDTGVGEWTTIRVTPSNEYVVFVFGVDTQGNLTSADLSYKEFKTLESTFDTASWVGYWTVTSPKTYVQQTNILTEEYEEMWTNDELTRDIEIVDAAEMGLEGYAIVYGWDGNFLMDGPAIGIYNDNKIELLNNEIVYEDASQGLVYQWLALSDIPAMDYYGIRVGGEYPAYIFAMDPAGNVTIEPYVGQITTGDEFSVCSFTIYPVIGEDIYVWNYTEPAYTFSGQGITAVKSAAPAPAPAKLSKNVKVMHKMANQKFVAKTFTATRFVK
jgi:hypothetical protein